MFQPCIEKLNSWFKEQAREFPWREERTPYRVWVSEIMLQQTRASVVIPYFIRWMELFPTIKELSEAPLEKVIKAWEGLGYYSRARNLQAGARQVLDFYGGDLPKDPEALSKIRGIGPYTLGAILSFGFQKRAPAVDGNVQRVISRYCLIEENVGKISAQRRIFSETEKLLDPKEPWVTMEALIELGATLCSPIPRCENCPLQTSCLAFRSGKAEALPIKKQPESTTQLNRAVLILTFKGNILVKKGGKGEVMADLYQFPYLEMGNKKFSKGEIEKKGEENYPLELSWERAFPPLHHSFTRFKAHLYPHHFNVAKKNEIDGAEWVNIKNLLTLPFSSGHRNIAKEIHREYVCKSSI